MTSRHETLACALHRLKAPEAPVLQEESPGDSAKTIDEAENETDAEEVDEDEGRKTEGNLRACFDSETDFSAISCAFFDSCQHYLKKRDGDAFCQKATAKAQRSP